MAGFSDLDSILHFSCPVCGTAILPSHATGAVLLCPTCTYELASGDVRSALETAGEAALKSTRLQDVESLASWAEDRGLASAMKALQSRAVRALNEAERLFLTPFQHGRLNEAEKGVARAVSLAGETEWGGKPVHLLVRELKRTLTEYRSTLEMARRAVGSEPEKAYGLLKPLVDQWKDEPEIQKLLQRCPPEPVGVVDLIPGRGDHLGLEWTASPSSGTVTYRVEREKVRACSAGWKKAGRFYKKKLIETDELETTVGIDSLLGYFVRFVVVALRDGVESRECKSDVFTPAAPPTELQVQPADCQLKGSWRVPEGCLGSQVRIAAKGEPEKSFETVDTTFHRAGLKNDVEHRVSVRARFYSHDGGEILSAPAEIVAKPAKMPEQVTDLYAVSEEDALVICWTPRSPCTLLLFRSETAISAKPPGTLLREEELRFSASRHIVSMPSGIHRFPAVPNGSYHILPVTVHNGWAILGQELLHNHVQTVKNLSLIPRDDQLELTWEWPEGCEMVWIGWSHSKPPTMKNHDASRQMGRSEYHMRGCLELDLDPGQPWHIRVLATHWSGTGTDRKMIHASLNDAHDLIHHEPGRAKSGGVVQWTVERSWLPFSRDTATLQMEAEEDLTLPPTVLVGKHDYLPVSPDDGTILLDLENQPLQGGVRETVTKFKADRKMQMRLFFKKEADYGRFKLEQKD